MATAPEKLSPVARIACESSELILSVASVWEIAIKQKIGKLPLPTDIRTFLDRLIAAQSIEENLSCITADPQIANLGAKRIW
jgi:PIN domain nuclease of toxin-antitoxin system